MKFSFLYAHKKSDKWNTPLSIINELKRRGHICNVYSIYNNQETGYSDDGIYRMLNDAHNKIFVPDVIMHMDFGLYKSQYLTKKYFDSALWLFESGDDPQSFRHYNYPKAVYGCFDIVFSPDIRCANEYIKQNINAIWLTHFADTDLYDTPEFIPMYDVVSTRDPSEPFFVDIKNELGSTFFTSRGFQGIEHTHALKNGKIVLQNSRYKEITRRIFEGMLANRMILTDRLPADTKIDTIFEEGKDIVYFDNTKDAIEKIKYYIAHDDERIYIANNGRNNVTLNHTQIQRVDSILNSINIIRRNDER